MSEREHDVVRQRVVGQERRSRIERLLREQGIASLSEIMQVGEVSEATARRDIIILEREGVVTRTRGGARVVTRRTSLEQEFESRQTEDRREKRALAQFVVNRLKDFVTLFLNDGTTTHSIAQCLVHRRLTVMTSGLNIAQLLATRESIDVFVAGGWLRGTSFGTVGHLTADAISNLHADIAFLSIDGLTLSGVFQNSMDDAAVIRAMSANATRTVVVATQTKIGRNALARALEWRQVDELVCTSLPEDYLEHLRRLGVEVTIPRTLG